MIGSHRSTNATSIWGRQHALHSHTPLQRVEHDYVTAIFGRVAGKLGGSTSMLSARHHDAFIARKHHRHLLNPADQAAVKSGSIDVFGATDDMQHLQEDTAMSGLSALENETDDFGRKLIQHQRGLNNQRENPRAFGKARPRPRIAERLEREEKEMVQQAEREHQRAASGSSLESEPPITIPREWGRKARRQNDWMKKIREPSTASTKVDGQKADVDEIYPRRTSHAYSGDDNPLLDWDAADRPLQSIENTPPSMRRRAQLPTPSSMHHMNTTIQADDDSEDGDFNAASLLASTPATRLPRKIDELTRREIENIERRGLATRALDHIDEISPNATRRASRNSLRDQALADGMAANPTSPTGRPISAPSAKVTSPSKIPRRPGSAIGNNKENLPFSEASASYKSSRTTGLSDRNAHAVSSKTASQHTSQRPGHRRNDSMGLLRRLAKVSNSMSPSPARERPASPEKQRKALSRPTSSGEGGGSLPTARKVDFKSEVDALSAPSVKSESHEDVQVEGYDEELSARTDPGDVARTPLITGAWMDSTNQIDDRDFAGGLNGDIQDAASTPATQEATLKQEKPGSAHEHVRSEQSDRRSALEDIVYQARHGDNTQQYGENTMASLEDIAHPNMEQTDPTITFDFDALKREQEAVDEDQLLTQDEKDRRQEDLAVEAMNKHLRAARSSIKDANRGLRRVENRIETAEERKARVATANIPSTSIKTVVKSDAKPHVYCTCGSQPAGGAWWALWTELRSCFYTYDTSTNPTSSSFLAIRPTWVGLAVLLWLTWYLSETTLCSYFCNPRFAAWVDGYPDPNAPEYPFVIPTLVFRPLRWAWKPVCEALAWSLGVVFHALFGDSSSSARPPRVVGGAGKMKGAGVGRKAWGAVKATGVGAEWAATATTVGKRVAQSVVDVVDEAGSMWDDERLV